MKKLLSILTVAVVAVAFSTTAFAMPKEVEKLKGGVKTVIYSPLEVKDHLMAEAKDDSFLPFSIPGGLLKGGFHMVKTAAGGVLDIATFPLSK